MAKLQAILDLRTQQLAQNEESYNKLKGRKKELERELRKRQEEATRFIEVEAQLEVIQNEKDVI